MILDVATESFLQHGYAATTMSAIAARLGGSKGTLWSYFPSKDVLFEAVLDRVTAAFRAQLSLILTPGDDVETTLLCFGREYLAKVTSPPAVALQRLVVGEAARFPEIGRIFFERAPRATWLQLSVFLESAMARGQIRRDDPYLAAQQLTALCMASCQLPLQVGVLSAMGPDQIPVEAARAVQLFMAAMTPPARHAK